MQFLYLCHTPHFLLLHETMVLYQLFQHEMIHFHTTLLQYLPLAYWTHPQHKSVTFKRCGSYTTKCKMRCNCPNFFWSRMQLPTQLKYLRFKRNPSHILSFCEVSYSFKNSWLYRVYNISRHGHWVMFFFHIQLNLYFNFEMMDHCMDHISFSMKGHLVRTWPSCLQKLQCLGLGLDLNLHF